MKCLFLQQQKMVLLTLFGRRSANYKVPPHIGGHHFVLCQQKYKRHSRATCYKYKWTPKSTHMWTRPPGRTLKKQHKWTTIISVICGIYFKLSTGTYPMSWWSSSKRELWVQLKRNSFKNLVGSTSIYRPPRRVNKEPLLGQSRMKLKPILMFVLLSRSSWS